MNKTPLRPWLHWSRQTVAPLSLIALGLASTAAWSQNGPAASAIEVASASVSSAPLEAPVSAPAVAASVDAVTLETTAMAPASVAPALDSTSGTPSAKSPAPVLNLGSNVADWKYTPRTSQENWVEKGVASWYGTAFHGKRTASGEVFNQFGMTAAHKTLPIPSYVKVRNVQNGREAIVRINDRGPFHPGRIIDLSYAAAQKLGSVNRPANVVIEPIDPDSVREGEWQQLALPPHAAQQNARAATLAMNASRAPRSKTEPATTDSPVHASTATPNRSGGDTDRTPTSTGRPVVTATAPAGASPKSAVGPLQVLSAERAPTTTGRGWWLQLGAFENQDGADVFYKQVGKALRGAEPLVTMFQEKMMHKVKVGPFPTRDEASNFGKRVRDMLSLSPMLVRRQ